MKDISTWWLSTAISYRLAARKCKISNCYLSSAKTGKPVGLNQWDFWERSMNGLMLQNTLQSKIKLSWSFLSNVGFGLTGTATRNTFDLSAVPLMKKLTHFPVIVRGQANIGILYPNGPCGCGKRSRWHDRRDSS